MLRIKKRVYILVSAVVILGVAAPLLYKKIQKHYIKVADAYLTVLIQKNPANLAEVEQIIGHLPHRIVQDEKKQLAVLLNIEFISALYPGYAYMRYKIGFGIYIDVVYSKDFSEVAHIFPHYAFKTNRIGKIDLIIGNDLSEEQKETMKKLLKENKTKWDYPLPKELDFLYEQGRREGQIPRP